MYIPSIYLFINVAANREADKLHIEIFECIDNSTQFSIINVTLLILTF